MLFIAAENRLTFDDNETNSALLGETLKTKLMLLQKQRQCDK
jgi:hypothetical protein